VLDSEFRVSGFGLRVLDSGFRVSGFGFRVYASGFRVYGLREFIDYKTIMTTY